MIRAVGPAGAIEVSGELTSFGLSDQIDLAELSIGNKPYGDDFFDTSFARDGLADTRKLCRFACLIHVVHPNKKCGAVGFLSYRNPTT
jgi:hypothetical protein